MLICSSAHLSLKLLLETMTDCASEYIVTHFVILYNDCEAKTISICLRTLMMACGSTFVMTMILHLAHGLL